jgi:hypothetical protein
MKAGQVQRTVDRVARLGVGKLKGQQLTCRHRVAGSP